ncbi:hypothetical protein J5N97_025136 [Dioscorea zingiberensis]|uniref:Cytochrome P450 n=1 Tax=Dioscorea zingiberensis TaxID=325984 RepID=A0A9D5C8R7_9LILI|nr:hypothetical protein J5N97_025136 [Dioscorea zingiberensis]
MLHRLRAKYGPIFTLYVGSRPVVFIMDGDLAHRSLMERSEIFADRPRPILATSDLNTNLLTINNTSYGSVWRLLRRNLASGVVNPCKATKSSTQVQRMALDILLKSLKKEAEANGGIVVPVHSIQHSVSFLMTSLCFGVALDEDVVDKIKNVQVGLLSLVDNRYALNLLPKVVLPLFLRRLPKLKQIRQAHEELLIPIIRARKKLAAQKSEQIGLMISYVDSLLKLRVPVDGVTGTTTTVLRELSEEDIVSFCSKFLDASIWPACAALEWIMIMAKEGDQISDGVKENVMIMADHHEYLIPKGAVVNYLVTSVGLDASVWEEPLEFRPERFMPGGEGEEVDVNCGKSEIKMMPFGAGRRMCPGSDLAMLQLQYLVANFVNEIVELKAVEGMEVDLSDQAGLFVAMKNPLHARITLS